MSNDKNSYKRIPLFAKKQQGTVLITVVLIAAFIIILVVEATKTVTYQKLLSTNLINRDQAYSYLMGMEELAKIWLKKAFEETKAETVNLSQPWAQDDINFPLDGGGMMATIKDMQSCFNLNSITQPGGQNQGGGNTKGGGGNTKGGGTPPVPSPTGFAQETPGQKVLEELIEKVDDKTQITGKALATAVRDWIDEDMEPAGPDGAEDSYYQGLEIPYRTANNSIAHISELRAIKDFNQVIYELIKPHVCVLPEKEVNKLNVNTIQLDSAVLIWAMLDSPDISLSDVTQALGNRPEEGWEKIEDFMAEFKSAPDAASGLFDVTSQFFEMSAKAEIGKTRVHMKTLFKKDADNNFKVVSRYFGRE